jgi:MoaA/NifB/PqqE/SkfB family radical SAM enzyme
MASYGGQARCLSRPAGSFEAVFRGIEYAKAVGIPFQINSTISKLNVNELSDIFEPRRSSRADAFHPFLLVPTGKAKDLIDLELAPDEYEENTALDRKAERGAADLCVKPTCAPHYYRIIRQEGLFRHASFQTRRFGAMRTDTAFLP